MKSLKFPMAVFAALFLMTACEKEDIVTTTQEPTTVNPTQQTVNNSSIMLGLSRFNFVEANFKVFEVAPNQRTYVFYLESPNLPTSFGGLFVSALMPNANETTMRNGNYRGDSTITTLSLSQQQLDSIAAGNTAGTISLMPTLYNNSNLTATVSNLRSNLGFTLDTLYDMNGNISSIERYTVDSATVVLGGFMTSLQGNVVPVSATLNARIEHQ